MQASVDRNLSTLLIRGALACGAVLTWTEFMPLAAYGQKPPALQRAVVTPSAPAQPASSAVSQPAPSAVSQPAQAVVTQAAVAQPAQAVVTQPIASAQPTPKATTAPTYPTPSAFGVDPTTPSLTLQYMLGTPNANGQFPIVGVGSGTKQIIIDVASVWGFVPATVDVSMTFAFGNNQVAIPYTIPAVPWKDDPGAYVITQTQLDALNVNVIGTINKLKTGFDSDTPLALQSPVTLNVTPNPLTGFALQKIAVDNPLQIITKQVAPAAATKLQAQPSGL